MAPGGTHASIPVLAKEVCLPPGEDTELRGVEHVGWQR